MAALVDAAYGHYVERIGRLPGPMTEDYREVIRDRQVTVAEAGGEVIGFVVTGPGDEGFLLDNVAVHPSHQGSGLGRTLLELAEAEARQAGFDSIYLYTHEKMTENITLYGRLGFVETGRGQEAVYDRVFMTKRLDVS